MDKKIIWSLSFVCFTMSTLLSLVGIISVIQIYFDVSIYSASLYASLFAGALGISSLITPAYFSRFDKRKLLLIVLIVTTVCNVTELFVTNYFVALFFRIIPAILYPIAVSSSLTMIEEISPNDTNKVVLGISAGSIVGLSLTSYLGLTYGYGTAMMWFVVTNLVSVVLTYLFVPSFEGNKEPVAMQIAHAKSKMFAFSVLYVLFVIIGISITYNYIPTYLSQITPITGEMLFVTLFIMGVMALVGTTFSGYLLNRDTNKSILFYPIGFAAVMFVLGLFVRMPLFEFITLVIFGLFDGSAYTVAQYWITSSIREAPEFANGIFLLMCNLSIFIGTMIGGMIIEIVDITYIFYGSILFMVLSIPFALIRIKLNPDIK